MMKPQPSSQATEIESVLRRYLCPIFRERTEGLVFTMHNGAEQQVWADYTAEAAEEEINGRKIPAACPF